MEIQKRSSSGRGEYEIAGSVSGLSTTDLLGKPLIIDTDSPLGRLPTDIVLKSQGGKPRLRRINGSGIQIQRQIEALLLMPKSTRDETQLLGGQPVVIADRYILNRIQITSAKLEPECAVIKLGQIDCVNDSGTHQINFPVRIRQIRHLYESKSRLPSDVAAALQAHETIVGTRLVIGKSTEKSVRDLIAATEETVKDSDMVLISGEDPIPLLLDLLSTQPTVEIPRIDEIDPQDVEIRRRVADRWRLQKDRGSSSTKFRRDVRKAYNSTCLCCGLRLPSSDEVRIPGVDAAHIVPWAEYEADVVGNGLCLCKLHHWAFDQYLLAVKHDAATGYKLVVTDLARTAFKDDPTVLESLEEVAGPIPPHRLPINPQDWPNPQFLKELYEGLRIDI